MYPHKISYIKYAHTGHFTIEAQCLNQSLVLSMSAKTILYFSHSHEFNNKCKFCGNTIKIDDKLSLIETVFRMGGNNAVEHLCTEGFLKSSV